VAPDDHAKRDSVERRADHSGCSAYVLHRVTAAAAVLDEHRFASARIALGDGARVIPQARALLGIFPKDPDEGEEEDQRCEDGEEGFTGD
jgi:hypothetical protein